MQETWQACVGCLPKHSPIGSLYIQTPWETAFESNYNLCESTQDYLLPMLNKDLLQTKPTSCTLILSIFILNSVHVSGNYVQIIRRTYCIYATLVFIILYGWLSGLQQTGQPPIQSEKYQCRIDTVSSPDDVHIVARNM